MNGVPNQMQNQVPKQNYQEKIDIKLSDIWHVFITKLPYMLIAAIVVVGGYFAYNKLTFSPRYQSTATLYILRRQDEGISGSTSSGDFSLALNLLKDCNYILKSHAVLDTVAEELNLSQSYASLKSSISTSNPENTRILEVTFVSSSPEQAKIIVDKVCEVGSEEITKAMGFKQTNVYEYGIINNSPINIVGTKTYVVAGGVAAAVVYAIFFLIRMFDNSIRTAEDIENYLGLAILGDIPNVDEAMGKKGGYRKYGKYGRYYSRYGRRYGKYSSKYGYGKYGYGKYSYRSYYGTSQAQNDEKKGDNK